MYVIKPEDVGIERWTVLWEDTKWTIYKILGWAVSIHESTFANGTHTVVGDPLIFNPVRCEIGSLFSWVGESDEIPPFFESCSDAESWIKAEEAKWDGSEEC